MVYRIYAEKKPGLDQEARALENDLKKLLGIEGIRELRILNRYDVEGLSEELFQYAVQTVFSEPQQDRTFRTLEEAGVPMPQGGAADLDLLQTPAERELIRQLALMPAEIETAARLLDPSRLTKYTVDLAAQFHKFYDSCKVRDAETPALRDARLLLCNAVRIVLGNTLGLLKVTAPERM